MKNLPSKRNYEFQIQKPCRVWFIGLLWDNNGVLGSKFFVVGKIDTKIAIILYYKHQNSKKC